MGRAFGQHNTCILCSLTIYKYCDFYMQFRSCAGPVSVLVVGNDKEEAAGRRREDNKW